MALMASRGKKEEKMVHEIRVVVDEEDIRKKMEAELEKFREHGERCVEIKNNFLDVLVDHDKVGIRFPLQHAVAFEGHYCGFKQKAEPEANLGMATTEELIKELRARGEVGSFGDSEVPRHQYLELAMDSLLGVLPDSMLNYSTWTDGERPSI